MRPFTFNPGPRLISGDGAAAQLPTSCRKDPACSSPTRMCCAWSDRRLPRGAGEGRARDHPVRRGRGRSVEETLLAAVELGRRHDVTHVVGFGGGSPMDVAKLAAYLLGSGDDLDEIWGVESPRAAAAAGAGADDRGHGPRPRRSRSSPAKAATSWRSTPAAGRRLGGARRQPDLGLPAHVTAATGIDAIVHSVEAYTSARLKNPLSDALAREARGCCRQSPRRSRPRVVDALGDAARRLSPASPSPTRRSRESMRWPIRWAAFTPAHGLANALMLRVVLQHNSEAARELYAELAPILARMRRAGEPGRCATLIDRLDGLVAASGLKPRLRDHGIAETDIPMLAGGDEADAAAGEQSLPDRGRMMRGGSTRPPGEPPVAAGGKLSLVHDLSDALGRQ